MKEKKLVGRWDDSETEDVLTAQAEQEFVDRLVIDVLDE